MRRSLCLPLGGGDFLLAMDETTEQSGKNEAKLPSLNS